jgi:hypothetical protein
MDNRLSPETGSLLDNLNHSSRKIQLWPGAIIPGPAAHPKKLKSSCLALLLTLNLEL